MKHTPIIILVLSFCLLSTSSAADVPIRWKITETIEIDKVPSWFPVGFALLTHGEGQYVTYYNEKHQMIIAHRKVTDKEFKKAELPSKVGWDSHNYITMAVDSNNCVHLSGNMHCVPLIYFRMEKPGDITTFKKLPMTGKQEKKATYPKFLKDKEGTLLFNYRDGSSGNGMRLWNRYDPKTKKWSRFFKTPMFDGKGKRNAYPRGPVQGPDDNFHVLWVWRETSDCATNHDLSYARSGDLRKWETAGGKPVKLPMTLEHEGLIVDDSPVGGGMINGGQTLAFDAKLRPIVAYHRNDKNDFMQIFIARFEDGKWKRHPLTKWEKKVKFGGGGAMPFIGIRISGIRRIDQDTSYITYRHKDYGSGRILIDDKTLQPLNKKISIHSDSPKGLMKKTIDFENIRVKISGDLGSPGKENVKYLLKWETLGPNHDKPRKPPLPPASPLQVLRLEK